MISVKYEISLNNEMKLKCTVNRGDNNNKVNKLDKPLNVQKSRDKWYGSGIVNEAVKGDNCKCFS